VVGVSSVLVLASLPIRDWEKLLGEKFNVTHIQSLRAVVYAKSYARVPINAPMTAVLLYPLVYECMSASG